MIEDSNSKLNDWGLKICWYWMNSEVNITSIVALHNSVLTWILLIKEGLRWDCIYTSKNI